LEEVREEKRSNGGQQNLHQESMAGPWGKGVCGKRRGKFQN